MSDVQPTHGPWHFYGESGVVCIEAGRREVAIIHGDSAEDFANARLIVASTDLLAALKGILASINQDTLNAGIDAVRKAEGRA